MNEAPRYEACALEVFDWLAARVAACEAAGSRASGYRSIPACASPSTSRTIWMCCATSPCTTGSAARSFWAPRARAGRRSWNWMAGRGTPGGVTLAAAQWALDRGVQVLRVHDVAAHRQLTFRRGVRATTTEGRNEATRMNGVIGLGAMGLGMARSLLRRACRARLRRAAGGGRGLGRGRRNGRGSSPAAAATARHRGGNGGRCRAGRAGPVGAKGAVPAMVPDGRGGAVQHGAGGAMRAPWQPRSRQPAPLLWTRR